MQQGALPVTRSLKLSRNLRRKGTPGTDLISDSSPLSQALRWEGDGLTLDELLRASALTDVASSRIEKQVQRK